MVCLTPLYPVPFPEHAMKLAPEKAAELKEGGGFNKLLDLLPRALEVGLALALADEGPLWRLSFGHGFLLGRCALVGGG
jgi:hypothetical protein